MNRQEQQELNEQMNEAFRRPMPVDRVYRDAKRMMAGGPLVALGPQARGALAVADVARDGGLVIGDNYVRSPWEVVKSDFRKMLLHSIVHDGAAEQVTYDDEGGTGRTINVAGFSTGWVDNTEAKLGYGTDGTAAAATDDWLLNEHATMEAITTSYNDTTLTANTSASRTHTEAGITAKEIVLGQEFATSIFFCVDRAVVADKVIATNDIVAVGYEVTV